MKRLIPLTAALLLLTSPVLAAESVQDLPMPRPLSQPVAGLAEKMKTLATRPRTPENTLALGIMQALSKQYAEAGQTLAPVKSTLPSMAGWTGLFLGYAKFRSGDYQGALAELEAVDPTETAIGPEALLLSAYCLDGLGSPLTLERYQRFLALGEHPMRPAALWRGAAAAATAGDYATAQNLLRELYLTAPWTASAEKAGPLARELARSGRISYSLDSPDSLRERIEVLLNKSQTAKAQALIDQYAKTPGADQARALYLKGKALYAKRDTQAAIQLFEDAARLSTEPLLTAWSVYHQARAYWRFSGPEDAARMEELLSESLRRAQALSDGADLTEACRRLLLLTRLERGRFQDALPMAVALAAPGLAPTEAREQAAWLSGLLRFAQGDFSGAESDLTSFLVAFPNSDYAPGAHYWTARSREAAGDSVRAWTSLRTVLERWPNGYYGMLAANRLAALKGTAITPSASATMADAEQAGLDGNTPPTPTETMPVSQNASNPCQAVDTQAVSDEAKQSLERAAVLQAGLLPELAERELATLNSRMPKDPAVAMRYARLATELGNHLNAVRAVSKAFWGCLARGSRQELLPLRDIVYPDRYQDLIARNLVATSVDGNIIRGLIRQESFFEPEAVSGAGAVGLMQVLPSTARSLAEKLGERGFKAESLKDPAVNVRYGVRYFLERYEEYGGNLALTLASYNAGRVKIGVWREFLGGLDQELFVEFIPYTETRDYVKRILGNQAMYALLY